MFSERYEQPDPISLPSERTHGDEGAVNQSDGKLELGTPQLPLSSLSTSLSLFQTLFYFFSNFSRVSRVLFTGRSFPSRATRDCVHTNDNTLIAIIYGN